MMLDMAGIGEGNRVLDVAAGAGEQTLAAARRVGPGGYVLATDISPSILDFAARSAGESGLAQVATRELDGERLEQLAEGSFDAAISRVGLIYFPDRQKALRGMRHAVREGGKVAAIVYSSADNNGFFSRPVSVIRRRANLPPPLPEQPGPFSLGTEDVLQRAFEEAGLRDVQVRTAKAPLELASSQECLQFEKESFGALHQMLSGLDENEQEAAWSEVAEELSSFDQTAGFSGPCELLVVVGTR
jgi:SAM-dependent methyltransferase